MTTPFATRYGPWALVAGASEGIGAAFATALAARDLNVVLVARRPEPLRALATKLYTKTVTVAADLATDEGLDAVFAATADLEIGLVVANAAYPGIGRFVDARQEDLDQIVDVNVRAPVRLARHYLPPMVGRGRGGLIVMSSIAGQQGSPGIATYAASKAFGNVFAEGLWAEVGGRGVDVLSCAPGAVTTDALSSAKASSTPGEVPAGRVVAEALRALGRRRPRVVPGTVSRLSAAVMARLLPRSAAIRIIGRASSDVKAPDTRL
jgi:short-subunit dehydrogenase